MRKPLFACVLLLALACPAPVNGAKAPKLMDIADTVAANRILTRFSQIIQSSDLGTFLSSKGPFTLFVPTDSAFAKIPPATLELLLQPQNKERLQHILLYHLVNGKKLSAKDLQTQTSLLSCEGLPLEIKKSRSGTQYVQKARIIHADIRCQNGVIHEIDTLIMPPESSLPPLSNVPPPTPEPTPTPTPSPTPAAETPAASAEVPAETNAAPVIPSDPNAIPVAPVAKPEEK